METEQFIQEFRSLIKRKFHILRMLKNPQPYGQLLMDNDTYVPYRFSDVNCVRLISFCDSNSTCMAIDMLHVYDVHRQMFSGNLSLHTMSLTQNSICKAWRALPRISQLHEGYRNIRYIVSNDVQRTPAVANRSQIVVTVKTGIADMVTYGVFSAVNSYICNRCWCCV